MNHVNGILLSMFEKALQDPLTSLETSERLMKAIAELKEAIALENLKQNLGDAFTKHETEN